MSVIREELNKNSALLRIKVAKNDYEKKVENAIEKARKQAKIPGFRPGHVPTSLIRKQYGKSILAEELNRTVNDFLQNYIKENNLQIDYSFYITNQIMKPLLQLFGLVLKDIWMSQKPPRRAKVTKLE